MIPSIGIARASMGRLVKSIWPLSQTSDRLTGRITVDGHSAHNAQVFLRHLFQEMEPLRMPDRSGRFVFEGCFTVGQNKVFRIEVPLYNISDVVKVPISASFSVAIDFRTASTLKSGTDASRSNFVFTKPRTTFSG